MSSVREGVVGVTESPWVACPLCGHEGYHEHRLDTGLIPGSNGAMIEVHQVGKVYPNHSYRCIICDHTWWTEIQYAMCWCGYEKVKGEPCGLPCV